MEEGEVEVMVTGWLAAWEIQFQNIRNRRFYFQPHFLIILHGHHLLHCSSSSTFVTHSHWILKGFGNLRTDECKKYLLVLLRLGRSRCIVRSTWIENSSSRALCMIYHHPQGEPRHQQR